VGQSTTQHREARKCPSQSQRCGGSSALALAHRVGEDEADLRLLAGQLGLQRADEVLAIAERTYGDRLDPAARFFVEQVFDAE
jgi:hypothetical protein